MRLRGSTMWILPDRANRVRPDLRASSRIEEAPSPPSPTVADPVGSCGNALYRWESPASCRWFPTLRTTPRTTSS